MIALLASWVPDRVVHIVGDSAYAGKSVSRYLPENVHLISRLVMNASLHEAPPPRQGQIGAPRKKGRRLPTPAALARSRALKWKKTRVRIYGRRVRVWLKTIDAMWYPSAGQRLLRLVIVQEPPRSPLPEGGSPSMSGCRYGLLHSPGFPDEKIGSARSSPNGSQKPKASCSMWQ